MTLYKLIIFTCIFYEDREGDAGQAYLKISLLRMFLAMNGVRGSRSRPGGEDKDSLFGHQGLVYAIPPEILLHGVNQEQALAGVKIIIRYWLNMRAYDLITLAWGSQQVLH